MQLAEFMQREGLSDEDLGKKIGRSRVSISRYRRRIEVPSAEVIKALVELSAGRITADELLGIEWVIR